MEYVLDNYTALLQEGSLTRLMQENNDVMVEILQQLQPATNKRKAGTTPTGPAAKSVKL
jgi:hypothetical protein